MIRLFRNELIKLFARKRTYIGFGAFVVLELVFLLLLRLPGSQRGLRRVLERQGAVFDEYFTGVTLAYLVVAATIFLLGSIYIALVSGDVVAKEVEDGTMRMMLCRPVARWRILAAKWMASAVYTAVLVAFIGATTLLMGLVAQGWGRVFVFSPMEGVMAFHDPWPGLGRYALGIGVLALTCQTIMAIGFCFSCFNIKPAAATILTLSVMLVDLVLRGTRYFESMEPWYLSGHMSVWVHAFAERIPWWRIAGSLVHLGAVMASVTLVGALHFVRRDFKN
jgi:ABC-2 type transport system permease protein